MLNLPAKKRWFAVSKTKTAEEILELYNLGQQVLGRKLCRRIIAENMSSF